jgi:hypothetical protein
MKVARLCVLSFFANSMAILIAGGTGWVTGKHMALLLIALPVTFLLATSGALCIVVQREVYPLNVPERSRRRSANSALHGRTARPVFHEWSHLSGDFGEQAAGDTSDPSTPEPESAQTAKLLKDLRRGRCRQMEGSQMSPAACSPKSGDSRARA